MLNISKYICILDFLLYIYIYYEIILGCFECNFKIKSSVSSMYNSLNAGYHTRRHTQIKFNNLGF